MNIPSNNSVMQGVLHKNPSTTFLQHRQISPTIFLCVHNYHTSSYSDKSHSNREINDIEEEKEDENTCKNETSIDDSSDVEEIEVIQLSDDGEDDEMNDESSGESSDKNIAKMDKYEINQFHNEFDESSLDITTWMQREQSTNLENLSGPSASQTEQDESSIRPKDEVKSGRNVFCGKVVKTLGFSCSECSVLIETRSMLAQHLHEVHGKLPFKCMIRGCNRQFTKRSLLNKHYEHHQKKQAKLICSAVDCQFETSIRQSFETHVYQHHDKGLFQCVQCIETYPLSSMVYKHLTKHKYFENKTNKRFQCDFKSCQFVAASKFRLKTHQLTHTKLRPFQCTWRDCGYAGKSLWNAIVHVRINHLHIPVTIKKAAQRNVKCDQDPYQFVRQIPYDMKEALRQELHNI